MSKEELAKLFEQYITVYPLRYACGIPFYPKKKKLVKKKAPTTAE
jgi:hypothetical protein